MTEKLYYKDRHLQEFDADVIYCVQTEKGWEITLVDTAFYPLGGGQAADTGVLGEVHVLDTQEKGEEILHLCDGPLKAGRRVHGKIDYESRFLRMQQHSGEHVVSGIIHRRWGWHNVGFHMNLNGIVIDFDGPIPGEALEEIEKEANGAVWQNIPLHIWTPDPQELETVVYRTKRALPWPVRIVEIPGYDTCACCGTHVAATGEIGLIKLFSAVPCRGGTRIEMACGGAALAMLNQVYDQNRQVSRLVSAQITQTAQVVRQTLDAMERLKFRQVGLERELFAIQAEKMAGAGNCFAFRQELTSDGLRELTDLAARKTGGITAVFSKNEGGFGYCLALPGGDLRAFNKEMTGALSGRGGGKPFFQQGRVGAEEAAIRAYFLGKGFREV